MQMVTVDVSATLASPWRIQIAILVNKTPRQIGAFLRRKANRGVLVFPFFTGTPEAVPNFRRVRRDDVMRPYYVGNLHPTVSAIAQIVERDTEGLRAMGAAIDIVVNESLEPSACRSTARCIG